MILVNTDYISGKELEMLGLVKVARCQWHLFGNDRSGAETYDPVKKCRQRYHPEL